MDNQKLDISSAKKLLTHGDDVVILTDDNRVYARETGKSFEERTKMAPLKPVDVALIKQDRKYLLADGTLYDSKKGKYTPALGGKIDRIYANGELVVFAVVGDKLYSQGEGPIGR